MRVSSEPAPSSGIKLGISLPKVANLLKSDAIMKRDSILEKECNNFMELLAIFTHFYYYYFYLFLLLLFIYIYIYIYIYLSKKIYDQISPTGSRPGIMYGLPKVHKPLVNGNPKFRQIPSAIDYAST